LNSNHARNITVNFDSGERICFCCSKLELIYALDRLKCCIYLLFFGNTLAAYFQSRLLAQVQEDNHREDRVALLGIPL